MRVGMRDVAKHAGVSVATVSHVLNQTRFVAEETRQRVLKSIAELDYSPDPLARSFKTGKRNLIGFIVPDIANRFWATMIDEVENVLSAQGKKLIISNTKETRGREIDNIRILASGVVDGLIIASTLQDFQQIQEVVPEDFRMVFVDRTVNRCPCDCIISSDHDAIFKGMQALIQEGHKRIGYIVGLDRLSTSKNRLAAYRETMKAYGLPIENGFIQQGDSMANSSLQLVQNLLDLECTAIVVSNQVMSDDVLFYFSSHDIRVNEDIGLLVYGSEDRAEYTQNGIHLILQPSAEMGRLAGRQILERIDNPSSPIKNILLYSALSR